ncbi:hypothetical protein [Microbulbifer discodermiae]|uniref:hypothetical protein n=1 Tax=Microbulbifer sp. 2201CG32-9 TaxID=3232309 RepID=UPI00345B94BA
MWEDPPGQCWEDFSHPVDELLQLVEGRIQLEIDGRLPPPRYRRESIDPGRCPPFRA